MRVLQHEKRIVMIVLQKLMSFTRDIEHLMLFH